MPQGEEKQNTTRAQERATQLQILHLALEHTSDIENGIYTLNYVQHPFQFYVCYFHLFLMLAAVEKSRELDSNFKCTLRTSGRQSTRVVTNYPRHGEIQAFRRSSQSGFSSSAGKYYGHDCVSAPQSILLTASQEQPLTLDRISGA